MIAALFLASATLSGPLQGPGFFPFVLPWDDARPTPMDVSFLNVKPAVKNGRVVARDGRFVESKTGKRVRFFGTNLGAEAAFPSKSDAPKIAARMAKLGINLVRFHHLNNGWALNGGTVWKQGRTFVEIDPAQLDKLDFFIAELKKQGIYSNINLQTAREYVPELGFPSSVGELKNFAKKVDKFNERMIVLQQQYARDLIGRKNPYTGLTYAEDPAIVKVEINNENSLVGWPGESPGAGLPGLPEPFRGELVALWNRWLKARYGTDEKLREAWPSRSALGNAVTSPASAWTYENQSNGDVSFQTQAVPGQVPTLVARIASNPGPGWHVQAHVGGLTLENGKTYTVFFRARADRPMAFNVDARLDKPDWRFLGLGASVAVGTEPKEIALTFRAQGAEPGHCRVGLTLGDARGTLTVENFRVVEGEVSMGMAPEESLEKGNIDLPAAGLSPRFRDYTRFLVETETAYSERMRKFLREDLGFRETNLVDTQIAWGGFTSLVRERQMEYADAHQYWNHPIFLGSDWDPKNYRVDRKALVNEAGGSWGTLGDLASWRIVGKPYSVSEYNHPAPNDFQVEMMPLYAAYAAYQDWDAIYTFAWEGTGTGVKNDQYESYFDMARNPSKSAFFPIAALVFRLGLVPPAPARAFLEAPFDLYEQVMTPAAAWAALGRTPRPLRERLGVRVGADKLGFTASEGADSVFQVREGTGGKIVQVDAPAAQAVVGFVGGQTVSSGDLTAAFERFGHDFAALMAAAKDGKPIASSGRVLIALGARFENQGMGWNAERTSVSDNWGKGPVMAEFVPARIVLKMDGPRRVYALDPIGARKTRVPAAYQHGRLSFRTQRAYETVWYEVVKP
jgi:hypothetical protein